MKKCQCCKILKEEIEFGNNKKNEDGKQKTCILCIREQQLKSYYKDKARYYKRTRKIIERNKIYVDDYKKQCSCLICNENRNWLLDFHHIDPKQKDFNISDSMGISINNIKKEIEKCVILCSNCHRDFHYLEKTKGITFEEYQRGVSPLPDTQ
jgi:hypothetical protein